MNTYRYEEERRKQWVREKMTRAKTVKQICREASISRATLYNWLEEFKELENGHQYDDSESSSSQKASKPELLKKASQEAGERYRMLVAALNGIDSNNNISKRLVAVLVKRFTLTVPQACAIVGIDEEVYGYKPRKPEVEDYIVYEALVNLIREDRSRDFETCYEIILKNNPDWTRKQIKRVYRDGMVYLERQRANTRWEKLGKAKNKSTGTTEVANAPAASGRVRKPGATWNLGLLEISSVVDGVNQPWWALFIQDEETGTALNATIGFGEIATDQILSFLDKAAMENDVPRKLKVPGKQAMTAREITRWVWEHKMTLYTLSLNKAENAEMVGNMENQFIRNINLEAVKTRSELHHAVENWIAVAEYA